MIFETERLLIRKLDLNDLEHFHQLESDPKVLMYATGKVKSLTANKTELIDLISKYDKHLNDFWIYAIERKLDAAFVGTVALVKDHTDDEIGYRFLQKYWGKGFGFEVCKATVKFCKQQGFKKLIGYCVDENIASVKILEKLNFKIVGHFMNDDTKLPETKYELKL